MSSTTHEPQQSPSVLSELISAVHTKTGFAVYFMIAVFTGLLLLTEKQALASLEFTAIQLWDILPFLALSVLLAALLKASGADQIVARVFEGRPAQAIIVASLFGALSPFCSCGVIPIVAGLLAAGVPIAPVLAFCIASPIMDPQMFVLTAASLGMDFTIAKTLAAAGMGMLAGFGTHLIAKTGALQDVLKPMAKPSCASSCSDKPKQSAPIVWSFWKDAERRNSFLDTAGSSAWFLGRWLALAFLLESLMIAYLPGNLVASHLGENSASTLPLAVLLGVPAYLNGFAAIPLIRGLIDLGMSPATGMTFMLAGSVTSIPAAIAVWSLAKPRLFGLYLAFAAFGSLLSGYAYLLWIG
ncbi:MAG: permease [Sneathiellales bacterium]|nr:permease [Sneathiellales bacterium]